MTEPPSIPSSPNARATAWLAPAGLVLIACIAFVPALVSPHASVDPDRVLRIGMLSTPRNIPAVFGPDFLFYTEGEYRPLGYAALTFGRAVARPESARFWAAWLFAFHVANVLLVFYLARLFVRSPLGAYIPAALLAVHPLAAVYAGDAAKFPYLLGGTLCLATLLCYVRFARAGGAWRLALSLVFFAAASLTTKAAWALPVVVLAYELAWERRGLAAAARAAPFVLLAAGAVALALLVRPHPIRFEYPPYATGSATITFYTFVASAPHFVRAFLFGPGVQPPPAEMIERTFRAVDPRFFVPAVLLVILPLFAVYELARRRWVGLGILLGVLGVLPFSTVALHRVSVFVSWDGWYLGLIGFALSMGALADSVAASPSRRVRLAARAGVALWAAALAVSLFHANVARRDAVSWWTAMAEANPRSEIASRRLGEALFEDGDRSGAMGRLFSPAIISLARSSLIAGEGYLRENELLAATIHFHRAERFEDSDPPMRNRVIDFAGRLTLAMGAVDYGEGSAAHALVNDPWDVDALAVLAESFRRKGYLRAARRHAEEALRIAPDDPEALRVREAIDAELCAPAAPEARTLRPPSPSLQAFLVSEVRRPDLCESVLKLADRLADDPVVQFESGMCLLSLGRTAQARERMSSVASRLPPHPFVLASRRVSAISESIEGEPAPTAPGDAALWNDMGYLLYQRGEHSEALACYRAAVAADPGLASAWNNLGLLLTVEKKRDEALPCYRKAIELAPGDPEAYRNLASALVAGGEYAEALKTLEAGAAAAPRDREMKLRLAWVLSTAPDEALRSGTRALKLAEEALAPGQLRRPNDLNILAAALAETGDFDRAAASAREAAALAAQEGNAELTAAVKERLALYERRLPYRAP